MVPALVIFLATYLVLIGAKLPFLRLDRLGAALAGAAAMVAFGVLTLRRSTATPSTGTRWSSSSG